MRQIPANIPEIIKEAATSLLGVFALAILVAGIVCIYLFRRSSDKVKIIVWIPIIVGIAMFGAASLKQSGENRANSNNTNQRSQIDESSTRSPAPEIIVALEIKENLSLKSAIETIAKSDLYTVEYDPGCEERFLNATVNGGEMKGNSSAEIIERLQDRLKDRRLRITYTVETYRERAIYAIQCVKK